MAFKIAMEIVPGWTKCQLFKPGKPSIILRQGIIKREDWNNVDEQISKSTRPGGICPDLDARGNHCHGRAGAAGSLDRQFVQQRDGEYLDLFREKTKEGQMAARKVRERELGAEVRQRQLGGRVCGF